LFQCFIFCFVSRVPASETKLKQICFVSVLFQFYFTCASRLRLYEWVLRSGKIQRRTCWSYDKTAADKPWIMWIILLCHQCLCNNNI